MKSHLMILLVLVVVLVAAVPNTSAQYGNCNGGGYGGWWGGYDMGYLYGVMAYNVPHFAAFPPVYYSYPVPRTYGYSPFAYPPGTMTPDVVMGGEEPLEIVNPYVPSKETSTTTADQSASAAPQDKRQPVPLVIVNPYVAGAKSIAQSGN